MSPTALLRRFVDSAGPCRRRLLSAAMGLAIAGGAIAQTGCSGPALMNASGRGYFNNGEYAAARHEFAQAAAADPENPDYAYNLARTMQAEGNIRGAEYQFRRAIAADPRHQPSYHHLSQMMADHGRGQDAMNLLTAWQGSQPFVAETHLEVAALQKRMGDLPSAESSLQQALAVRPGHPKALAHLGEVYQQTGRAQEAVVAYSQSLKTDPTQSALQSRIAMLTTPAPTGSGTDATLTGLDGRSSQPFRPAAMPASPTQSLAMMGRSPQSTPTASPYPTTSPTGEPVMSLAGLPLAAPAQAVRRSPGQSMPPMPAGAAMPGSVMIASRPIPTPVQPSMASVRPQPVVAQSSYNAFAGGPMPARSIQPTPARHEPRSFGRPIASAPMMSPMPTMMPMPAPTYRPTFQPMPPAGAQPIAQGRSTTYPTAPQPTAGPRPVPTMPSGIQQASYEAAAVPSSSAWGPSLPAVDAGPALPPALQTTGSPRPMSSQPRVITPLPGPGWQATETTMQPSTEPPTLSAF